MTSALKKPWGLKSKAVVDHEVAPTLSAEDSGKLLSYIDENVVGKGTSFCGPFGRRKVVYCDYNGSGRALQFLEEHVSRDVLPTHATQCTAMSHTSLQSCLYRSEAREYALSFVGGSEEDAVILGASPTRLLRALRPERPTVFVSARVPERQLSPWRECDAEIIKIPETKEGFIDLTSLEHKLQENSGFGRKMIGFFPAASKLTGLLTDDVATTCLLHQYGAWSFWDYSLVAPSAAVEMNSAISSPNFVEEQTVKKDAIFFNCEKFVGGVQAPYVAVVKKHIFNNTPLYTDDLVALAERIEECGAVEAARATLVLQLRDAVGLQTLAHKQDRITKQVLQHIKNIPELILLGNESPTGRRLPIFSLLVKHPRGTFLHHNFVCAILNDVFGIQARGGLSGNLNYGQDVLGIDAQLLREYEKLLHDDVNKTGARNPKTANTKPNEHLRPGFCRISLPFFMSDEELGFVLEALKMVATEGWKILPQYVVNQENGQWRHHTNAVFRDRKSLFSIRYHDGKMTSHERRISGPGIFPQNYTECLQTARNLFNRARKLAMKCPIAEQEAFNPRMDYLRWFMLPKEAHDLLLGKSANVKHIVPFDPSGYTGARKSMLYRGGITSSPTLGCSPRHYSLSAIDDCALLRLKQKTKFYSREASLLEKDNEAYTPLKSPPVQFAVGESMSPVHFGSQECTTTNPLTIRSRCYSLGSDMPSPALSPQTRMNLGITGISDTEKKNSFCNCGSQTDLQSLDDPMVSPTRMFPYSAQCSTSISDCSQVGRTSPTASITSHTSEDLQAYVKEMTKEIAIEIKSEIREVISQVDDILENSDSVEASNASITSNSSHYDRNSVSVTDVAQYLMGMSREMASEVTHEIREMVNQVDEMISPDMLNMSSSRRSSPPQAALRRRIGSGPELGLELKNPSSPRSLRKCPTSPILTSQMCVDQDDSSCCVGSPKSAQGTPLHEASGPNRSSFNSSETSTPETIIQVISASFDSPTMPKSLSSNKFSDDDMCCADTICKHYCNKKTWCQNPSVSSQDSGINMCFPENESYQDFVKWRTCSDPTHKGKRMQGRLKSCQRYEKSEVPDIIEGVPVCSGDYLRQYGPCCNTTDMGRVDSQIPDNTDSRESRVSTCEMEAERCARSLKSSGSLDDRSDCLRYEEEQRVSQDMPPQFDELRKVSSFYQREGGSDSDSDDEAETAARRASESSNTDSSTADFTHDDDGKWHLPTKSIWKATIEAIDEYGMIRHQDKVLVGLSGGRESLALLHTIHQYQFYARSRGIHFTTGAIFVHGPKSDIDPLHLMAYCRTLGVKFIYQDKSEDLEKARSRHGGGEAYRWATHGVRRRVYSAAAAQGYSVVALAQHLDHAARAFLASVFHRGALRTTRAHYYVREHNLRIIRPFIYVRESDLLDFSVSSQLPDFRSDKGSSEGSPDPEPIQESRQCEGRCHVGEESPMRDRSVSEPCGQAAREPAAAAERGRARSQPAHVARDILLYHEQLYPCLFTSLKNALHPLISAKNIEKDLKEHRHRKKSVIQMKNGAPVYDSEEGTDEDPVP